MDTKTFLKSVGTTWFVKHSYITYVDNTVIEEITKSSIVRSRTFNSNKDSHRDIINLLYKNNKEVKEPTKEKIEYDKYLKKVFEYFNNKTENKNGIVTVALPFTDVTAKLVDDTIRKTATLCRSKFVTLFDYEDIVGYCWQWVMKELNKNSKIDLPLVTKCCRFCIIDLVREKLKKATQVYDIGVLDAAPEGDLKDSNNATYKQTRGAMKDYMDTVSITDNTDKYLDLLNILHSFNVGTNERKYVEILYTQYCPEVVDFAPSEFTVDMSDVNLKSKNTVDKFISNTLGCKSKYDSKLEEIKNTVFSKIKTVYNIK